MSSRLRPVSLVGRVVGSFFVLLFSAVFLIGGLWIRSTTQPLDDGVIVVGTVVDIDERVDSDGSRTYAPVVEFVDPGTNATHRVEATVATSSRPTLGSPKDVSLRPGDPSSARVVGPAWFPWLFIGVGVAMPVLTLGFGRAVRRARRKVTIAMQPAQPTQSGHDWTIETAGEPQVLETAPLDPLTSGPGQPGYHPDPEDDRRLRYWDGVRWTDRYAPVLFED